MKEILLGIVLSVALGLPAMAEPGNGVDCTGLEGLGEPKNLGQANKYVRTEDPYLSDPNNLRDLWEQFYEPAGWSWPEFHRFYQSICHE